MGTCLRKSITSLRPYLSSGIKELDIPALNPLVIPEIKISHSAGAINLESAYKDIVIFGATRFRLRKVQVDLEQNKFRCKLWFPGLTMEANYDLKGKIMVMPIQGAGKCYGNFTDIDALMQLKANRFVKNGKEHFKVKDLNIEFNIGNANLELEVGSIYNKNLLAQFTIIFFQNLFNGDPEMSSNINRYINENWKLVTAEIRPTLELSLSGIIKEVADKIFDTYPIEKLLS